MSNPDRIEAAVHAYQAALAQGRAERATLHAHVLADQVPALLDALRRAEKTYHYARPAADPLPQERAIRHAARTHRYRTSEALAAAEVLERWYREMPRTPAALGAYFASHSHLHALDTLLADARARPPATPLRVVTAARRRGLRVACPCGSFVTLPRDRDHVACDCGGLCIDREAPHADA